MEIDSSHFKGIFAILSMMEHMNMDWHELSSLVINEDEEVYKLVNNEGKTIISCEF